MDTRTLQAWQCAKYHPDDFRDVYLCDISGISATELANQPADWVDKMRLWHEAKTKAEDVRAKEQERKAGRDRLSHS